MKIAIVGAGMTGMSTALFFQQKGLKPVIYEAMDSISDFPLRSGVNLPVYTKPIYDSFQHIRTKYNLNLKPHEKVKQIKWHSQNAHASAHGFLGHIVLRGDHPDSLDNQFLKHIDSKIKWGESKNPHDLLDKYHAVIDASGESDEGKLIQFTSAEIQGQFDTSSINIWHTSSSTPGGFAYLIPISPRAANVFLVTPDIQANWMELWRLITRDLGYEPSLRSKTKISKKLVSKVSPSTTPRLVKAGNSLGTIAPFLGMDHLACLSSSYAAVEHILGRKNYQAEIQDLTLRLENMARIQDFMQNLTDFQVDRLVNLIAIGGTQFFRSKLNLLQFVSWLVKPLI